MRTARAHEINYTTTIASTRANTLKDAQAWGRTAAALNWGLSALADEVEPRFHAAAKQSYERRMKQLYGAPF